jgi:hypothetical protein
MADPPLSEFRLRLSGEPERAVDPQELEQLALELRRELVDLSGVAGVDRVAEGPSPDGTRSVELVALGVTYMIKTVSVATDLVKIIEFVKAWLVRRAAPRGLTLTIDGVRVEVETPAAEVAAPVLLRAGSARTAGRRALIVANATYEDPALRGLRSPGSDAQALADVLRDPGIGDFEVDLLMDADERTLRRQVAGFFAQRDPDDLLLLHFSCHGLKDIDGQLYLAAADTELAMLSSTALSAAFVAGEMSRSAAKRVVLILDCCYSGAFARGTSVRGDSAVHLDEYFRGGTGRIVLTASSATEYAFEGDQISAGTVAPSVFTGALVNGLRTGEADLNSDGQISIDELYTHAFRTVSESPSTQQPQRWTYGTTGEVVIARSSRRLALPPDIQSDLDSGRLVLWLEAVTQLRNLLSDARPGMRVAAAAKLTELASGHDHNQVRSAAAAALGQAIGAPPVEQVSAVPPGGPADAAPRDGRAAVAPAQRGPGDERPTAPADERPSAQADEPPTAPGDGASTTVPTAAEAPPATTRLAGAFAAVGGIVWSIAAVAVDVGGAGDVLGRALVPAFVAVLGVLTAALPARRVQLAASALGGLGIWSLVWASRFVGMEIRVGSSSPQTGDNAGAAGVLLAGLAPVVLAVALVLRPLVRDASWRAMRTRPAIAAGGLAGVATVLASVVLLSLPLSPPDYLVMFATAPIVAAAATVSKPGRRGDAVLLGFAAGFVIHIPASVPLDPTGDDYPWVLVLAAVLVAIALLAGRLPRYISFIDGQSEPDRGGRADGVVLVVAGLVLAIGAWLVQESVPLDNDMVIAEAGFDSRSLTSIWTVQAALSWWLAHGIYAVLALLGILLAIGRRVAIAGFAVGLTSWLLYLMALNLVGAYDADLPRIEAIGSIAMLAAAGLAAARVWGPSLLTRPPVVRIPAAVLLGVAMWFATALAIPAAVNFIDVYNVDRVENLLKYGGPLPVVFLAAIAVLRRPPPDLGLATVGGWLTGAVLVGAAWPALIDVGRHTGLGAPLGSDAVIAGISVAVVAAVLGWLARDARRSARS